jgi:hypothetical protein
MNQQETVATAPKSIRCVKCGDEIEATSFDDSNSVYWVHSKNGECECGRPVVEGWFAL